MFERFTGRARRVIVLAQEEARLLHHPYIGTEHLLLGLIAEGDGIAARALAELDLRLTRARGLVAARAPRGVGPGRGHIPFTPRAKTALERSLREALALGHNYIGTEHLLLGIVRAGEGVACDVLAAAGHDLAHVRATVVRLLEERGSGVPPEPAGAVPPRPPDDGFRLLGRASDRALGSVLHARAQAARDGQTEVTALTLARALVTAGDDVVLRALADVGGSAPPAEVDAPEPADALPLAGDARAACVHALRYADPEGPVGPAHLLLGCLQTLDDGASADLSARIGTDAGVLASALSWRLGPQ